MPTRLSTILSVTPAALASHGAFDGFIDIDSRLYIDPYLLRTVEAPELADSYATYRGHFDEVFRLLRPLERPEGRLFREACARLTFREIPSVALGYSSKTTHGSGIGASLAAQIALTAWEIIQAGVDDPTIFDLVGLIEDNVGADRISDMVASIILPHLGAYSKRVAEAVGAPVGEYDVQGTTYVLPTNPATNAPFILLPKEILRTLPVANCWSDIDVVAGENAALRNKVNEIIGDTWRSATRKAKKADLRRVLLGHPELIRDLLARYQAKEGKPYDFDADPEGLIVWHEVAQDFAARFPVALQSPSTAEEVAGVVRTICEHFGSLIEDNGLCKLLYGDDGKLRHERYAQLVFFGVAESYCKANNLDLSPEVDSGRGPVDFKVSAGFEARVAVETKYTSNPKLFHGFDKQLPIYANAEKTSFAIYVILRTTDSEASIERVLAARNKAVQEHRRAPYVFVFDARIKPSASTA